MTIITRSGGQEGHLVVVVSTTHLGVEFLDGISLGKSSLVSTELEGDW